MPSWLNKIKEQGQNALGRLEDAASGDSNSVGGGSSYAQAPTMQYASGQSQPAPQSHFNAAPPPHVFSASSQTGKYHVAYFTNWSIYGRKYHPNKIPVDRLTHILYSFADVREDGTVFLTDSWSDVEIHYDGDSWNDTGKNLYGNFKQLLRMKQGNRHLKLLLSIGGWTFSPHFAAMQKPECRARFVESAMKILDDVGLDGLDVDWEYPKDAQQAQQYVHLLAELRRALDARSHAVQGRHWLSIAAPCGEQMNMLDVRAMNPYLDMWNLMAYDFSGTWSTHVAHHANLLDVAGSQSSVDRAVNFYLSQGVEAHKLVIGMPLYARAFANTNGLGEKFNGVPEGGAEPGNFFYCDLPLAGHQERYDQQACAAYSTHPSKRQFASYDNPQSVDAKCDYILRRGLGGAMWWELSGDVDAANVDRALIPRAAYRLAQLDRTPNNLHYPYSQYDNVRSGQHL